MPKARCVWDVAATTSLATLTLLSSQVLEMKLDDDVRGTHAVAVAAQMGYIPSQTLSSRSTVFQEMSIPAYNHREPVVRYMYIYFGLLEMQS